MTIKENIGYLHYFGFKLTFFKTWAVLVNKITKNKYRKVVSEKNNQVIEQYLEKILREKAPSEETELYIDYTNTDILPNNVIWTMWWQGEENVPEIIKRCIDSMRKNSNGHPVIVLDEKNWDTYVKLPDIIMWRYREGRKKSILKNIVLDITHLSDILRCLLLIKYGGVWMDASIYVSYPLREELFQENWSTLGQDDFYCIGDGKWSTFFMGALQGNKLLKEVYEMHIWYWKKKKYYVNYLMFDYMIDLCCKRNTQLQLMIDNVKTGNKKCLDVNRYRDQYISQEKWKLFLEQQQFHKLSWRWWGREKNAVLQLEKGSYLERLLSEQD